MPFEVSPVKLFFDLAKGPNDHDKSYVCSRRAIQGGMAYLWHLMLERGRDEWKNGNTFLEGCHPGRCRDIPRPNGRKKNQGWGKIPMELGPRHGKWRKRDIGFVWKGESHGE